MQWAVVVVFGSLCACEKQPAPIVPVPTPAVAPRLSIETPVDTADATLSDAATVTATDPATDPASVDAAGVTEAPPKPRPPGIHPVLVLTTVDPRPNAYILACAHVQQGLPTRMMNGKTCAPHLWKVNLEVILPDGSRKPVKLGARGKGSACPETLMQPYVKVTGLPKGLARTAFVVSRGTVMHVRDPQPATLEAIKAKHPALPSKRPDHAGDEDPGGIDIDLDGDGSYEVIDHHLELFRIFRANGNEIGRVGCVFG